MPPVSGGAVDSAAVHARVVSEPLSLDALASRVRDARAGAVVTFSGVTRDVERLDYEAYAEMAEAELRRIAAAALERHGLCSVAVEHRTGAVPLSEASVIVAASAPHRAEAFAGAREVIDEVKARAPIWKHPVFVQDAAAAPFSSQASSQSPAPALPSTHQPAASGLPSAALRG